MPRARASRPPLRRSLPLRSVVERAPRTLVVDIEPLIAAWDTGQASLDHGVACFLDKVEAMPSVPAVCFATNSRRHLPVVITRERQDIRYLASACKPFRAAPYRDLPRPGMVIGDQVATDGALAWRLGYSFIHYYPNAADVPLGPKLMRYIGFALQPFLFLQQQRQSPRTQTRPSTPGG
jgi:predicted HAD superfamily phosphohydrolase YqeG